MSHWLLKSEPDVYSIQDLKRDGSTEWEGVRNYQARNFLRDQIKKGDLVFFYHSNSEPSGIAGIAKVVKEGFPDASAWNKKSPHYDPRSSQEKPVWYAVQIKFIKAFKTLIDLQMLRSAAELNQMGLLKRGQRLSVQPVRESK